MTIQEARKKLSHELRRYAKEHKLDRDGMAKRLETNRSTAQRLMTETDYTVNLKVCINALELLDIHMDITIEPRSEEE